MICLDLVSGSVCNQERRCYLLECDWLSRMREKSPTLPVTFVFSIAGNFIKKHSQVQKVDATLSSLPFPLYSVEFVALYIVSFLI